MKNILPMALTESSTLDREFAMPDFLLPDVVTGEQLSGAACAGAKGTAIVFLCRHCPYVVHVLPALLDAARDYIPRGIAFAGISANDAESYPDDAPDNLAEMARDRQFPFPVLYDASQQTAKAFRAQCTPEFFVFDAAGKLFYHGRMDASTPGNGLPCTGADLRGALDALLAGGAPVSPQLPSMGCNIKWK